MKVKSISYIHSFNVTGFLNDKAGMEIELNEGDSEDEAFAFAIQKTKEIAAKVQEAVNVLQNGYEVPVVPLKESKPDPAMNRTAALIADIYSCTELKVLESYKLIVKQTPELQEAYNQKLKELQP